MNELPEDLARAFRALDVRATRRAERVDPERVAARVIERLRAEDAPVRRVLPFGYQLSAFRYPLAAAAALAVLVIGGAVARGAFLGDTPRPPFAIAAPVALQSVDSLSQTQLEAVLQVADQVRPVLTEYSRSSGNALEDLNEQQLQALLRAVQQSEGGTL